jgi:hypothetical protein
VTLPLVADRYSYLGDEFYSCAARSTRLNAAAIAQRRGRDPSEHPPLTDQAGLSPGKQGAGSFRAKPPAVPIDSASVCATSATDEPRLSGFERAVVAR